MKELPLWAAILLVIATLGVCAVLIPYERAVCPDGMAYSPRLAICIQGAEPEWK